MSHLMKYNGISSADYGLHLSGEDTWRKPSPEFERTAVPGRNGDLIVSNRRYSNVDITYHAGIYHNFDQNYTAYINAILAEPGYHRLEDSYPPDVYRMAVIEHSFEPEMSTLNHHGMIAIKFNCKPQTFLRSGDQKLTFTGTGTIFNPTMFTAKPLLRIFGKGTVDIGDESITVLSNDSYTDVDCESEEAYMDDAASPRNNLVRVSGDDFPVLPPGQTHIRLSGGIQKLEVIPRWWKL